jgi:beta-galactosidase/beta-glucuronidase
MSHCFGPNVRLRASAEFAERCTHQLEELIRQSFHHPSIVTWGIGNEVQTHTQGAAELLRTLAVVVSRGRRRPGAHVFRASRWSRASGNVPARMAVSSTISSSSRRCAVQAPRRR